MMRFQLALSAEAIDNRVSDRFHGVGMIRAEYFCRLQRKYVTIPETRYAIRDYLYRVCRIFAPHPVWYRTLDMETAEINFLEGCDRVLVEKTTMLGWRGVRRAWICPEAFLLELGTVAEVARENPNLHVLIPFVSVPEEVDFVRTCLDKVGFDNRLAIMAEIPATILCLEDFLARNVSGITVGLNDLASLTTGTYRGLEPGSFANPAVRLLMKRAAETCRGRGIPVSLAGYVTHDVLRYAEELGYDYAVVSYSKLQDLFGPEFAHLPHRVDLGAIKQRARVRMCQPVVDPTVEVSFPRGQF